MAHFHAVDWVLVALFFLVTLGIAGYHAYTSKRTTSDYLLGNRTLNTFPVAISMVASLYSATLVLGTPAEVYTRGGMYWLVVAGSSICVILCSLIFVPVFYPLKITSVNEYLRLRYNSNFVAILASIGSILSLTLSSATALFGLAVAIETITDKIIATWMGIVVCGIVTCIYTAVGGIKGVIWTDVFQSLLMVITLLAILIEICLFVGGVDRVWKINQENDRLDFNEFSPDPTIKYTFWSLVFAHIFSGFRRYGHGQTTVQRFCSVPNLCQARIAVLLIIPCLVIFMSLAVFTGLALFAYYKDIGCDPLESKIVDNVNQLVPHFILYSVQQPGFAGLLVAGLLSASLSSASANLNSIAANLWRDILRKIWTKLPATTNVWITKTIVIIFGALAIGLSFAIQALGGTLIQLVITFNSTISGPSSAIFIMGIFLPFTNWIGASVGAVTGFVFGLWLGFGSYSIDKQKDYLPSDISNCTSYASDILGDASRFHEHSWSTTSSIYDIPNNSIENNPLYKFYSISFLWIGFYTMMLSMIIGILVSLMTGCSRGKVDPRTLHPWIHRCLSGENLETYNEHIDEASDEIEKEETFINPQTNSNNYGSLSPKTT